MAEIVVKKFGGTSVGSIERIHHVGTLLSNFLNQFPAQRLIVVVSAMSGETNRLIELAKQCAKNPDPREMDVLLTTGEQVSIALLSMVLIEQGIKARSFIAPQARISTEGRHTNAQIRDIDTRAVRESLERDEVAIVAGFQGTDERGDLTTLGRGGSDITAVALAAAFEAKECHIYTDVPGVFSADPRICSNAIMLGRVCHEEMLEMASLGAKVLHPRSVYFAMRYKVPLVVRSTFESGEGTWIVREKELMEKPIVTAITHRLDEAKVTVWALPGGSKALNSLFGALAEADVFVDMISQSTSGSETANVSFTIPESESERALKIVEPLVPQLGAQEVTLDRNVAKVSIVGIGMRHHSGVAAKVFAALESEGIDVEMIGTSEIKISVAIPRKYCELAVRALHHAFVEMKPDLLVEK